MLRQRKGKEEGAYARYIGAQDSGDNDERAQPLDRQEQQEVIDELERENAATNRTYRLFLTILTGGLFALKIFFGLKAFRVYVNSRQMADDNFGFCPFSVHGMGSHWRFGWFPAALELVSAVSFALMAAGMHTGAREKVVNAMKFSASVGVTCWFFSGASFANMLWFTGLNIVVGGLCIMGIYAIKDSETKLQALKASTYDYKGA